MGWHRLRNMGCVTLRRGMLEAGLIRAVCHLARASASGGATRFYGRRSTGNLLYRSWRLRFCIHNHEAAHQYSLVYRHGVKVQVDDRSSRQQ